MTQIFLALAAALLVQQQTPVQSATGDAPPAGQELKAVEEYDVDLVTYGEAEAPVRAIAYVSPTCPHCAHFYNDVLPELQETLIASGELSLILRGLPTQPAAMSIGAMAVADCASDSDAVTDLVFAEQGRWFTEAQAGDPLGVLVEAGEAGGLDEDAVRACLSDEARLAEFQDAAIAAAQQYGLKGVPSFRINGQTYMADQLPDAAAWEDKVDALAAE